MMETVIERIRGGDVRAVARALSLIENNHSARSVELLKALFPFTGDAVIVGITGSPGAGKSTLVDQLARIYRQWKERVGILCVDPTSPFSGGAILGDRIRMQSHSRDEGVFIRSMATRGRMGGLSAAVNDALIVLDAAGYKRLLVETVGAGQDEVEIVKTAHATVVVLVPGMGDDIQTIKAGLMEIGDIFVINKADHEGVLRTHREIEALLSIAPRPDGWVPPVLQTIAGQGKGVREVADAVEAYLDFRKRPGRDQRRDRALQQERLLEMARDRVLRDLIGKVSEDELERAAEQVLNHEIDPHSAVERLLGRMKDEGQGQG